MFHRIHFLDWHSTQKNRVWLYIFRGASKCSNLSCPLLRQSNQNQFFRWRQGNCPSWYWYWTRNRHHSTRNTPFPLESGQFEVSSRSNWGHLQKMHWEGARDTLRNEQGPAIIPSVIFWQFEIFYMFVFFYHIYFWRYFCIFVRTFYDFQIVNQRLITSFILEGWKDKIAKIWIRHQILIKLGLCSTI